MTQWRDRNAYKKWLNYYKAVDDRSGFVVKSHQLKKDHHGRYTTHNNWDPKHPTEYVFPRVRDDSLRSKYLRPEGPDQWVSMPVVWNTLTKTWDTIEIDWDTLE
jgi:hypothetical protein